MKKKTNGFYKNQKKQLTENKIAEKITLQSIKEHNDGTPEGFDTLVKSTLSDAGTDKELISILRGLWLSIKRIGASIGDQSVIIQNLFSIVAELFYLHKDKQIRYKQKIKQLDSRIHDYSNNIKDFEKQKEISEKTIQLMEFDYIDVTEEGQLRKVFKPVPKKLTQSERKEINDIKYKIVDIKIKIREEYAKLRAAKDSKQLRLYDVSKDGKLIHDPSSQLMAKNEKVAKILKSFGLSSSIIQANVETETISLSSVEKGLNMFSEKIAVNKGDF